MDAAGAAFRATIQLVAGALYAYAGGIVLRREVSAVERRANRLFALWWMALAGAFVLSALAQLLAILGAIPLPLSIVVLDLELILLAVGIWGVAYYLLYLFTGNERWFGWVTGFYAVVAILLQVAAFYLDPQGVDETGAPSARAPLPRPVSLALLAMLLLPLLLGAIAYGSIFFRTREAVARYRVALVAVAFILQAAWPIVSNAMSLQTRSVGVTAASTSVSAIAALLVLAAFRPPASLGRGLGPDEKAAALARRIHDLI